MMTERTSDRGNGEGYKNLVLGRGREEKGRVWRRNDRGGSI